MRYQWTCLGPVSHVSGSLGIDERARLSRTSEPHWKSSEKHTSDDTSGTQHSAVNSGALNDGADDPQDTRDLEGDLAREAVGDEGTGE